MTSTQIIATITVLVSIIGIVAASATALIVAYLHRRQMRQVELFKLDPSVGLIPPASKFTIFVKSRWDLILGVGGPAFTIFVQLIKSDPIARWDILIISSCVALISYNVIIQKLYTFSNSVSQIIDELIDISKENQSISRDSYTALSESYKVLSSSQTEHLRITEKLSAVVEKSLNLKSEE